MNTFQTPKKTVYKERAILAGAFFPEQDDPLKTELIEELKHLSNTAGAEVQEILTQNRTRPDYKYFVGSGKTDEIQHAIEEHDADVVIFMNDLSPAQVKNLEEKLDADVLDRSELILDIFSLHARTRAAKLQVELARLKYTLPRLKRMWTHLSRQEGVQGTRGPGERQIELDRRLANERITKLKEKLEEEKERKKRQVSKRSKNFTVSLVGYTNAGKSTLMNRLTGTEVKTKDQLFSTLSTKTKKWETKSGEDILISDTVGFIRNLPHHLIASFRSTLEETNQADLLLHVVDASHPNADDHIRSVRNVLEDIGADDIPSLLLFNKQDKIEDQFDYSVLQSNHPEAIEISAKTGEGLDLLEEEIEEIIDERRVELNLRIPQSEGKLISQVNHRGKILEQNPNEQNIEIHTKIGYRWAMRIPDEYIMNTSNGEVLNGHNQNGTLE